MLSSDICDTLSAAVNFIVFFSIHISSVLCFKIYNVYHIIVMRILLQSVIVAEAPDNFIEKDHLMSVVAVIYI